MNSNPMLKIKNLTVRYHKYGSELTALDGLDLDGLVPGSWTFLTGSNGSGKSSLFNAVTGRVPGYTGLIEIEGRNVADMSPKELSGLVFLINQDPLNCTIEELTVWENLLFATRSKSKAELLDALIQAGLTQHQHHLVKNLSGGQRQLLALQIVRLRAVKLLLLDEPFAALDPENVTLSLQLIKDLQQTGTAIFFITHDLQLLQRMEDCPRTIYILKNGKLTPST